jgi:hypothetical protein
VSFVLVLEKKNEKETTLIYNVYCNTIKNMLDVTYIIDKNLKCIINVKQQQNLILLRLLYHYVFF